MYMYISRSPCTSASVLPIDLSHIVPSHSRPAVLTAGQEWPHSQSHTDDCSQLAETGLFTAPTRGSGGQY